jgi:hypothetical protein
VVTEAAQVRVRVPEIGGGRVAAVFRDDDVLADPDVVEAQFLRLDGGAADAVGAGLAADMGQVDAKLHRCFLLPLSAQN